MSTLLLKVLCGKCGNKIGEVYGDDDPGAFRYRPVFPGGSSKEDSISSGRFWCGDHGWASESEIHDALTKASPKRVSTLRATVGG